MTKDRFLRRLNRVRMLSTAAIATALLATIGSTPAAAQYAFEYDYGSTECNEIGYKGVAPVVNCAGGGFIAAGYTEQTQPFSACGTKDVYVVRTDAAGVRLWEFRYDIGGFNRDDIGYSVAETPDGFVVTGTTMEMNNMNTEIFLLKINCNGQFQWAQVYGRQNANDEARDITLTNFGNPGVGTNPGDFVIAGWTTNPFACQSGPGLNRDALLLRINNLGMLVWSAAYDGCIFNEQRYGCDDFFMALVEARVARQGVAQGDIVAVGGTNSYTPLQAAWAVRVDGNNGGMIAPMAGIYSGLNENGCFNGVCELTIGAQAGNLVYAGWADFYGATDVYVVKSGPSPCNRLAERSHGDLTAGPRNQDVAQDVIERTKAFSYWGMGVIGDVFLTGYTNNGQNGTDAFLLHLTPLNLAYRGGFVYGDHGDLNDAGYSLMDDNQQPDPNSALVGGFVICGLNTRIPLGGAVPEQDLYLLKTNRQGGTGCENIWNPDEVAEYWYQRCVFPCINADIDWYPAGLTMKTEVNWDHLLCSATLPRINSQQDQLGSVVAGEADAVTSYPNPVHSGKPLSIDFASDGAHEIAVTVANTLGQQVHAATTPPTTGPVSMTIPTQGWVAGTYMVSVDDGEKTRTVRVVVVE